MSAYADAFKALTAETAMNPGEVALLLTAVLNEHAAELATQQRTYADATWALAANDSLANVRRKRARRGAAHTVANLIDPPTRPAINLPHQRDGAHENGPTT